MLKTYDVIQTPAGRAATAPRQYARPWWQTAQLDAFEGRLPAMTFDELESLYGDLRVAVAGCGLDVTDESLDLERRRSARNALKWLTLKRDAVQLELATRGRRSEP